MKYIFNELLASRKNADDVMIMVITSSDLQIRARFINKNFKNFLNKTMAHGYLIKKLDNKIGLAYKENNNDYRVSINIQGFKYNLPVIFYKEKDGKLMNLMRADIAAIRKNIGKVS